MLKRSIHLELDLLRGPRTSSPPNEKLPLRVRPGAPASRFVLLSIGARRLFNEVNDVHEMIFSGLVV